MSGTEALARVLAAADGHDPDDGLNFPLRVTRYWAQAVRILADPGLLAALTEAGVLERTGRQTRYGEVRDVYAAPWQPADWKRKEATDA